MYKEAIERCDECATRRVSLIPFVYALIQAKLPLALLSVLVCVSEPLLIQRPSVAPHLLHDGSLSHTLKGLLSNPRPELLLRKLRTLTKSFQFVYRLLWAVIFLVMSSLRNPLVRQPSISLSESSLVFTFLKYYEKHLYAFHTW